MELLTTIKVETTLVFRHGDELDPEILVNLSSSPAMNATMNETFKRYLDLGVLNEYVTWVREDDEDDADVIADAMPELERTVLRGYSIEAERVATESVIA